MKNIIRLLSFTVIIILTVNQQTNAQFLPVPGTNSIYTVGKVGINTNAPTVPLEIRTSESYAGDLLKVRPSASSSYGLTLKTVADFNLVKYVFDLRNASIDYPNTMVIDRGNIGIGTANPTSMLTVAGKIESREVKVSVGSGADFVFKNNYELRDLEKLESYVKAHHHLPEIPSEKEMLENGLEVGEFQIKLLQKIEELTLYIIDQNKLKEVMQKNEKLESRIETLEK